MLEKFEEAGRQAGQVGTFNQRGGQGHSGTGSGVHVLHMIVFEGERAGGGP